MAKAKTPKNRPKIRVQPVKLTNAAKIREVKRLLPLLSAQGLLNSVVLTVRTPFVANVADCEFQLPALVSAREDYVDFAKLSPNESVMFRPRLLLNLKVFHANKAHLLTIYIHSADRQTYVLTNSKTGNDHIGQTLDAQSGDATILFAFLPTKAGLQRFSFTPDRSGGKTTSQFDFRRVEIDVLT